MLRKALIQLAARYYLRKPEAASLIEARYPTSKGLIRVGLNQVAAILRLKRIWTLTAILLEVTNHCNLKCLMCPTNRLSRRAKGYISLDLVRKILDENPGLEYVQLFTWGEPLMHPQLFEIIEMIGARGTRPCTITNGTLLSGDKIDKIIASRLYNIVISVDGTGPDYEKVRNFSYSKLEQNIARLIQRRNESGSKLRIELNMTISKENEAGVELFQQTWADKVDRLQIQPQVYVGNAPPDLKRTKPCWEPWSGSLCVHWDGIVAPCCVDYDDEVVVGDATKEPLAKILNGEKMRRLRQQMLDGKFPPLCEKCVEYATTWVNPRFE